MLRKLIFALIAVASLGYGSVVGGLYAYQRDLIYPIPEPDDDMPSGYEPISYRTSDNLELHAGFRARQDGKPVLLFFHGNGIDWKTAEFTAELLGDRGYGVLAAEYRGYDGNPGGPSEEGLYLDGRAALAWLTERGISSADIILAGNSLGSGVATELARTGQFKALVLISPMKSLVATAANAYPYIPTDSMIEDRFENIAKIGEVTSPILIVHGVDDRLIPIEHARELAAANPAAVLVEVPGAGHNLSPKEEGQLPQLEFLEGLGA